MVPNGAIFFAPTENSAPSAFIRTSDLRAFCYEDLKLHFKGDIMRACFICLTAAFGAVAGANAQTLTLQPGEWETTTTETFVDESGIEDVNSWTESICIAPADADYEAAQFASSGCTASDSRMEDGILRFHETCDDDFMTLSGEAAVRQNKSDGSIRIEESFIGDDMILGPIAIDRVITSSWTGDC